MLKTRRKNSSSYINPLNLSKRLKDLEEAEAELYLLTSYDVQSEDITNFYSDLMDIIESEFTTFLIKNATHTDRLATPEKA